MAEYEITKSGKTETQQKSLFPVHGALHIRKFAIKITVSVIWSAGRYVWRLIVASLLFAGCNATRHLQEGEYLLVENTIRIKGENFLSSSFSSEEIGSYIRQKPNRKIFGLFRFHLLIYNVTMRNKVSDEIKKIVGEPPVVFSERHMHESARQIQRYFRSKGYFNAIVEDSVLLRNQRASVFFTVTPGRPHHIRDIIYQVEDPAISDIVTADTVNRLIARGANYDEEIMQSERERITRQLKDRGYYYFNKEYIRYIADSILGTQMINLEMVFTNQVKYVSEDSVVESVHRPLIIRNIYVRYDYNPLQVDVVPRDTFHCDGIYFTGNSPLEFKPSAIAAMVRFRKGDLYRISAAEYTYKSLSSLQVFKFINVKFTDVTDETGSGMLDCIIQLSPVTRQSFSIETEGTNSGGAYGMAGNLVYRNKNVFGGAESFEFKVKAAMESQKSLTAGGDEPGITEPIPFFNTLEIGPEAGIYFPEFLLPFHDKKKWDANRPRTSFIVSYNYQLRPTFKRDIARGAMSYEWSRFRPAGSISQKHIIQPVNVNIIKLDPESQVLQDLSGYTDPFMRASYTDHLISSTIYSYVFSNQDVKKSRPFMYFKVNIEAAGNLLRWISPTIGVADTQGWYNIFNIRYAQYCRADADYRFYYPLNRHNTVVTRMVCGAGLPYGNSRDQQTGYAALPFEKSFFGGGANDIRAWYARTLGPGSYFDKINFDRTGDIKLAGNFEYRADIYKIFKAAFFLDAGNVWLMFKDPQRDSAHFNADRFISELAVGTGAGLRIDPGFFIFRIDFGIPVKVPDAPPGERWIFEPKTNYNIARNDKGMKPYASRPTVNFAIGYPF